jgi:hypothetical protein
MSTYRTLRASLSVASSDAPPHAAVIVLPCIPCRSCGVSSTCFALPLVSHMAGGTRSLVGWEREADGQVRRESLWSMSSRYSPSSSVRPSSIFLPLLRLPPLTPAQTSCSVLHKDEMGAGAVKSDRAAAGGDEGKPEATVAGGTPRASDISSYRGAPSDALRCTKRSATLSPASTPMTGRGSRGSEPAVVRIHAPPGPPAQSPWPALSQSVRPALHDQQDTRPHAPALALLPALFPLFLLKDDGEPVRPVRPASACAKEKYEDIFSSFIASTTKTEAHRDRLVRATCMKNACRAPSRRLGRLA